MKTLLLRPLLLLLRGYQLLLSPMLGQRCRFYPSCSHYAMEALQVHGVRAGGWMALKRLGRCHPWHEGGVDPVPPAEATPSAPSAPSAPSPTTACGCHHHS